jgi:hypothetical protein
MFKRLFTRIRRIIEAAAMKEKVQFKEQMMVVMDTRGKKKTIKK